MPSRRDEQNPLAMSSVGLVCFDTEVSVSPMTIDLILPLEGEQMSLDELQQMFEERFVANNPRFRCRVESGKFIPTEVDMQRHVMELDVPSPGSDEQVMELISRLTNEAMDHAYPLWNVYLINREDTQFIFIRMHHCIGDGVSLATATMRMSDSGNESSGAPKQQKKPHAKPSLCSPASCMQLLKYVKILLWILIGIPLVLLKWFKLFVLTPHDPTLFERVNEQMVSQRHVAWNVKPIYVEEIKEIGKQLGTNATFNDIMLAAVSGAFDRYTEFVGKEVKETSLTLSIPVNIRRTLPKEMGNKIGGYLMNLPLGIRDHKKRCKQIVTQTAGSKRLPEQYASYWMFVLLSYCPMSLVKPLFHRMSRQVNCVVTNVRGSEKSYFYEGREVRRLIGFIPPPDGVPIGVAISSLAGQVNISVKADRGLIRDPMKFVQFIHDELDSMRSFKKKMQ